MTSSVNVPSTMPCSLLRYEVSAALRIRSENCGKRKTAWRGRFRMSVENPIGSQSCKSPPLPWNVNTGSNRRGEDNVLPCLRKPRRCPPRWQPGSVAGIPTLQNQRMSIDLAQRPAGQRCWQRGNFAGGITRRRFEQTNIRRSHRSRSQQVSGSMREA